jgi:hypothetical protein
MKRYRFFFHYNKPNRKMTVHYRGRCYIARNIRCEQNVETKWNSRQPYLVMQGMAEVVDYDPDTDTSTRG